MRPPELHEIVAVSDHKECFSKALNDVFEMGCNCKYDTVETRVVGTDVVRNWQFARGRSPFQVGQKVTDHDIKYAQLHGMERALEDRRAETQESSQGKDESNRSQAPGA